MITKIKIKGYRIHRDFELKPNAKMNLLVGGNDAGKSSLMEAISLALTGRIGGRQAFEELNPYWFNTDIVSSFVTDLIIGRASPWPTISIELFLDNRPELQCLCGAHNSAIPTMACPGVTLSVIPNPEYDAELRAWSENPTMLLPVEYYKVDWRSFGDYELVRRPRELSTAIIDSRTIRASGGLDYHLRQILNDHLEAPEKALISLQYREAKAAMSGGALAELNKRLGALEASLQQQPLKLAMDQTSRTSWESAIAPHVDDVPFSMAGQGQQASVKISLAMGRHADRTKIVMIEEPENHLSHTSLVTLLNRIEKLAGEQQQLFISTHSAYVLNRLGLDSLLLINRDAVATITGLDPTTVGYYKKLPGFDTLRMALAKKLVLVEGPSDEIIFERIFADLYGERPMAFGIDVLSMRSLSLARCLELCSKLDKPVAVLRDNDGEDPELLRDSVKGWLDGHQRELFIGTVALGKTLEPQLISHNDEADLRTILKVPVKSNLAKWMKGNKTEGAIRLAESDEKITAPAYMAEAAAFIHG
ncbi:ATP-dependent nuclease [Pseudomonas syringae]|uniref:ATP-dependent nuclease n=1 Tax=Pseudomonas syringae TaxID=317 RepID=UPI000BB5FEC9|nr:AAA family ATPase [Pseudomonas syringae]PBP76095.1 ATP-dependent endonuclease [Pseudomonas syringae]